MHYFLTFRTCGTWLHGDERGSIARTHNQIGTPLLDEDVNLERYRRRLMKSSPVILDEHCRACIDKTLREVASHRG